MQGFLTIIHGNVYGRLQCRPSIDNVLGRPYHRPRETSLVTAYIFIQWHFVVSLGDSWFNLVPWTWMIPMDELETN